MMAEESANYLYLNHELTEGGLIDGSALEPFTERHAVRLEPRSMDSLKDPFAEMEKQDVRGVVLRMGLGYPYRTHMRLAKRAMAMGKKVFMHWPAEEAVELVDNERLRSYWRHWLFIKANKALLGIPKSAVKIARSGEVKPVKPMDKIHWTQVSAASLTANDGAVDMVTDDSEALYQASSQDLALDEGMIPMFNLKGVIHEGAVSVGLLNEKKDAWLGMKRIEQGAFDEKLVFGNDGSKSVSLVIANAGLKHTSSLAISVAEGFMGEERETGSGAPDVSQTLRNSRPVRIGGTRLNPSGKVGISGVGAYLRMDFWAKISSGGSYGHTCYVAKELNKASDGLVCFMAHRYTMLDDIGLKQVVLPEASPYSNEEDIASATQFYFQLLAPEMEKLKPSYIYERICLGNYTGAALSQRFGIPYIVEYNGSEISMKRSFEGCGYKLESFYLDAEMAAFRQATMISVISDIVRDDLVRRGVDPAKILVNPNGADPDDYAPLPQDQRARLREDLGFGDTDCVIGFTGTFGGWHGIDVLAEALPKICARAPEAKWMIIGSGHYKPKLDEAVEKSGFADRTHMAGRVPQKEGARLLGACDIYVSPHNTHMIDSKFFGSPTKIFEYMAMGGGIVASDLEQIGQSLSPALRVADFNGADPMITNQRSVLCVPGDVEEFSDAVVALVRNAGIRQKLGSNARKAVFDEYSWERHVERLFRFMSPGTASTDPARRVETGDAYKDQVQNQWNNDPCGSHYVKEAEKHSLEWFLEAERYRYGVYAPWMPQVMEFDSHSGEKVLEIGGGMGTDHAQFAKNGAIVTDLDLSAGHLELARRNFALRGLKGEFIHHDGESLPFQDGLFDLVYSNGVIHHTPNTQKVVDEIFRVLKPGGKAVIMVYAENSFNYWMNLVHRDGLKKGALLSRSMGDIMSAGVEISENNARPLVKVYTARRLRQMFRRFTGIQILKRQLMKEDMPERLHWLPLGMAERFMGWNLIIKAFKPRS